MTDEKLKEHEVSEQEPKPQKKGFWGILYEILTYQPESETQEVVNRCKNIFNHINTQHLNKYLS